MYGQERRGARDAAPAGQGTPQSACQRAGASPLQRTTRLSVQIAPLFHIHKYSSDPRGCKVGEAL